MNERIRELAKQAGGEFYEGFAGSPNAVRFMETELEKFAKSIVEECADIADKAEPYKASDLIKKHFGEKKEKTK